MRTLLQGGWLQATPNMIPDGDGTRDASRWLSPAAGKALRHASRRVPAAAFIALGFGVPGGIRPAAHAGGESDAAAEAARERAYTMQRYVVSATRVDKNPWRYASVPGFEVITRASDEATTWWIDGLRRGRWIEDNLLPADWLPDSPVPCTVIIDDTNLDAVSGGLIHSQPIVFEPPADALTWGRLADRTNTWTDHFEAHDHDTYAIESNVYGVDTRTASCILGMERVLRCTPALPRWLVVGLMGQNCGVFRESFMPVIYSSEGGVIREASGPGTLWVSLDETRRILKQLRKEKKPKIAMPALGGLFAEAPPADADYALWESEAGLFTRWGLLGPGHDDPALSRAFLELVRRARREPVTERVFTECFGFGYAAMESRLGAFLRDVLAQPTSVDLDMPGRFREPDLNEATADQIGRILGDWLRMEGDSLRKQDPGTASEFLNAAGRMLERAYRNDNGLPPDVEPSHAGTQPAKPSSNAGYGSAVVMKPFVVTATHIHDPGLLAVYGLYESNVGDSGKAREFLEAAARDGVVRPMVYLVLAQLRYSEAMARPLGPGGRLSLQQATSITEPLRTALGYPVLPGIFGMIVDTWSRCEARPGRQEIDEIVDGVAQFPRNMPLAYRSALLCIQSGYAAEGARLIDRGLLFADREDSRKYFERLRSSLADPVAQVPK
jgi:hypothetical protein